MTDAASITSEAFDKIYASYVEVARRHNMSEQSAMVAAVAHVIANQSTSRTRHPAVEAAIPLTN